MRSIRNSFKKKQMPYLRKKGSAIVMVMILSIALLVILSSQLNRGVTSKKLNLSNAIMYEAKNAAESYAEYGCADVATRFRTKTSFPRNELKNNPIYVPSSSTSFYSGSNMDLNKTEVKGGQIEDGYWIYLDEDDPRWEFDPLKGKRIFVRDIQIYAKATAKTQQLNNRESVAYVQQTLQVRDSPLFSNAIFYNLDLELNPGPNMDVYGTVHTNKDIWVGVNNGSYLKFHEPVSATGKFYHGDKEDQNSNPHRSGLRGDVYIADAGDTFQPVKLGGTGANDNDWLDSKHANWRELSSQTWDGNVQDQSHNVPSYNAAGIADHVPDDPNTYTSELQNHAYAIIEPILHSSHPDVKDAAVRNQKMMAKAGLIFRVEKDTTTDTGFRVRAYKWARQNSSVPVNTLEPFDGNLTVDAQGNPTLVEIQIPDPAIAGVSVSHPLIGAANPNITRVDNTGFTDNIPQPEFYEEDGSGKVDRGLYDHRQDIEMSLVTLDVEVLRQIVDDNANPVGTNLGDEYWKDPDTNSITYSPTTDWNGVVYIEFPLEDDSGGAADKIVRAKREDEGQVTGSNYVDVGNYNGDYAWSSSYGRYVSRWERPDWYADYQYYFRYDLQTVKTVHLGLQLINGGLIPSPTYMKDSGMTIATNVPMYVIDHYNADGSAHTNDAQEIEHSHYRNYNDVAYDEPPAALMADTITLLSQQWKPNVSNGNHRYYSSESDKWNRKVNSQRLEVSAALVTGITPTIPEGTVMWPSNGAGSGGAINLPRFLEHWNGNTVTLRTSLIALFESEVHTEPYHDYFNHFYIPPVRDWGFNENFDNGVFPPGTPNVRTFRRTKFQDISEAEYTAGTVF